MSIALIVFVIAVIALIVICYAATAFSYYNKEAKKEIRPTKLYLAGPITGVSNAKAKFQMAKNNLERYGFIVVTPFENGLSDKATYEQHMAADFKLIDKCDSIALMPGWSGSVGCMMELEHCLYKDKVFVYSLCFTGNYYAIMHVKHIEHILNKLFLDQRDEEFMLIRDNNNLGKKFLIAVYISMLKVNPKYADLQ